MKDLKGIAIIGASTSAKELAQLAVDRDIKVIIIADNTVPIQEEITSIKSIPIVPIEPLIETCVLEKASHKDKPWYLQYSKKHYK